MSSDLRKSLESIQSLLSQTVASPMTATSLTSRLYQTTNTSHHHSLNNNNNTTNNNDYYMNLHSPSISTVNDNGGGGGGMLSPQTPATQATLPSGMPGGSRFQPQQQQQRPEEERYSSSTNNNGGFHNNYIDSNSTSNQKNGRASNGSSHHSMLHSRISSTGGTTGGGGQYSERSSSICNFSNSTPYQINTVASSLAFSSGGDGVGVGSSSAHGTTGGAVIGSPLSAFSAVNNSNGGKLSNYGLADHQHYQKQERQQQNFAAGGYDDDDDGLDRSSLRGGEGGGKRETMMSLLVSPPTARMDDAATVATAATVAKSATVVNPATAAAAAAAASMTTPKENEHRRNDDDDDHDQNDGIVNPNPNAKDPTPYHYRANPPARDYSIRSNHHHQQYQQHYHHHHGRAQQQREEYHSNTSSSTSSSSRSIDPPAKSPFGSVIPAGGSGGGHYNRNHYQQQQHHYHHQASTPNPNHPSHSHPITELSIIEEDHENNIHNNLNHSHTSTVTGFTTLPRTPVLRDIKNHVNTFSNPHSGSRAAGGGGGNVVAFASTPGGGDANNSIKSSSFLAATPSTDKLLRRPSAAMRDSFQQLASQTAHQLEDIWDLVGIVPEERASQLADLVDRIASICHEKIDQEEQLAEQFRKEIATARFEWEESCAVLRIDEEDPLVKMKRDPSVNGTAGVSLQSEYEVMMSRLESIRSLKEAAMEDIVASQQRIYEAYAALNGCTVEEAQCSAELEGWADTKTNLTEEQRELFRSKAVEYEESIVSRTQAVVSLLVDCQNLIRELEIVPPGCDGQDESEGYVEVGQYEDDVKIMNSLKSIQRSNNDDDGGRPRSRGKSSDSYTVTSIFESSSCIGIGKDALDRLTSRIAELNGEKRRRRNKLGEMGAAIASLWSMLRVPSEEQRAFTNSIRGLGMDTLDKGERELSRLHELKAVMIGRLIREQRQTIEELWERTNSSEAEKAAFDRYFYVTDEDELTDVLLAKHEEYAGALNAKLEKMQPILDLIERRESIIEERVELDMLQKDPDRLKGRNASKQLMKEEKMMRRVQKELPKITNHLEKKLKDWYAENKPSQTDDDVRDEDLGHFMYKGLPYLKTMKTQEHEWMTRKERGEQERQRKRQEERSTSSGSAFGSTYSKLPGKKWNPPLPLPPSTDRPRSASNLRPGSRGLRPGDVNRVRPGDVNRVDIPAVKTTKIVAKSSGYGRAASAPRMRL